MFSWQYDEEPYVTIRNDEDKFDLRPSNTIMYLFDEIHSDADHIFRIVEDDGERYMGFRIWRSLVDKALGEDMFDKMCDELHEHGFDHDESSEPSTLDIQAWEQFTGLSYTSRPVIENIVDKAMAQLDAEWAYIASE